MKTTLASLLAALCLFACTTPPDGGQGGGQGGGAGGGSGETCPPAQPSVTYYKDVLPITQRSCHGCHAEGGIGPFPLDSYEAAKDKAALMVNATDSRRMPPWKASQECGGEFVGDRSLTQEQIDTIALWFSECTPEGNPADAPEPIDHTAEQLPRTDFEFTMTQAYTPALRDDYRCFTVDPALISSKSVIGYDIVPGSKKVVHHVIMYIITRSQAAAAEARDAQPGWECFGGSNAGGDQALGAWAPGGAAVLFPQGTGISLDPNQVLAMQVHYNTDNGVEADQTTIKLMYSDTPVTAAYLLPVVASGFAIPPNAQGYEYSESFGNPAATLGLTIKLWGLLPHMHTRGKRITMSADNGCLVDVPDWDFHWQTQYFRKAPYFMSPSDRVVMSCTWDNPSNQTITWGEGTTDEMCFAFIYATP